MKLDKIPESLLMEVLVRLPVKPVFRSKLVCKEWLSTISDPYFVCMYISRASKSQPWAFIDGLTRTNGSRYSNSMVLSDIYTQNLENPIVYELPRPHGVKDIIGASNGLILCVQDIDKRDGCYYIILNHVTGQRIALPRPPLSLPPLIRSNHVASIGFIAPLIRSNHVTSIDFITRVENGILTSYGIVHLCWPVLSYDFIPHRPVVFEVFRSEIGEWRVFTLFIHYKVQLISRMGPKSYNGILHWMTRKHGMIAYDPYRNPESYRLIALPRDSDLATNGKTEYCGLLDVHQGKLRYFESSFENPNELSSFGMWLLNDYSTGDWCLLHRVRSANVLYDSIRSDMGKIVFLHPFDSNIVYMGYGDIIVSYNIKTRKLESHSSPNGHSNRLTYWTFLLVMPPWPTSIPQQS